MTYHPLTSAIAAALLLTAAPAIAETPANGGKAQAVGQAVGSVAGAVAGGAVAGTFGGGTNAGNAGSAAGALAGEKIGGAVGAYLDKRAEDNQRTGRGGAEDPRYDPRSLFND